MKKSFGRFTFRVFACTVLIAGGVAEFPSTAADIQKPPAVQRVSASQATGQRGQKLITIYLIPGYGVNLSFIPTGETVQKVWFDNPSIATLDVDGCLKGLGSECQQERASVLHLRSIKSMNIPGLPKTNRSLLTVITNGSNGRSIYLFLVVNNSTLVKNHVHTVEVVPDAIALSPSTLTPLPSVIDAQVNFNQMHRGLMVAFNQGLIIKNSLLWNRIVSFLAEVRSGKPLSIAAQTSGISMQLVTKLQELGNITNSPTHSNINNNLIPRTEVLLK